MERDDLDALIDERVRYTIAHVAEHLPFYRQWFKKNNIHPEEIEGALMMIEGDGEALVVPLPDPEYGHRPIAFITTRKENKPDDEAITRAMHTLVGKLKSPIRYLRIEEWRTLPGSQKTDRAWYQRVALTPDGPFA